MVYADKERKLRLFEKYEYAKENLIQLLHYGLKMTEINRDLTEVQQHKRNKKCGKRRKMKWIRFM